MTWQIDNIPGLCEIDQPQKMVCMNTHTFFTSSNWRRQLSGELWALSECTVRKDLIILQSTASLLEVFSLFLFIFSPDGGILACVQYIRHRFWWGVLCGLRWIWHSFSQRFGLDGFSMSILNGVSSPGGLLTMWNLQPSFWMLLNGEANGGYSIWHRRHCMLVWVLVVYLHILLSLIMVFQ